MKFLTFRCHFKFSKFDLNKILHEFPSFWKYFKLLSKQWNSPQNITFPQNIFPSKHTFSVFFNNCVNFSWLEEYPLISYLTMFYLIILHSIEWDLVSTKFNGLFSSANNLIFWAMLGAPVKKQLIDRSHLFYIN